MRHKKYFILLLIIAIIFSCTEIDDEKTISISGAWALYPLVIKWKEEYFKEHPEVKIEVTAGGAGKGISDVLAGLMDLAMVSRPIIEDEKKEKAYAWSVARDAVVPTLNANNPLKNKIQERGLTIDELKKIWIDKSISYWNQLDGIFEKVKINLYTRADACGAAQVWADFLNAKQEDLAGIQVNGDPGLAEAVIKDSLGLGFNNIAFAYDAKTFRPIEGLEILKIDFNKNGKIDPDESFYDTLDKLIKAINKGLYPAPPARILYLVTKDYPNKKAVRNFLNWIYTKGQDYIAEAGFIKLSEKEIEAERLKLGF